jgi:hypothetical protein
MCRPYIAGVLHGDGWCTGLTLGLRVKDHDFAKCFSEALFAEHGKLYSPKTDERGYWIIRTSNKTGRFSHLRQYEPNDIDEVIWWLRGLFDSEGNAQLTPRTKQGPNSYSRRIAMYSTNVDTLKKAEEFMEWLEVPCLIRATRSSSSHKGSKTVFELRVLRREGFERFARVVGTNIQRKHQVIEKIVASYQPHGWQAKNWEKAMMSRWPQRISAP